MKIYITVEINERDIVFNNLTDIEKLSIDIAYNKYKFDTLKDKQEKRLEYIATEISIQKIDVMVGNACHNLYEILYLKNELNKHSLSLDTVFIPSPTRIAQRLAEAKENAKNHSRWIGADETDVERNFTAFKVTLDEIKNRLSKENIKVVEC